MGAWIEIFGDNSLVALTKLSLLAWERGLKSAALKEGDVVDGSLLAWERGLKSHMVEIIPI